MTVHLTPRNIPNTNKRMTAEPATYCTIDLIDVAVKFFFHYLTFCEAPPFLIAKISNNYNELANVNRLKHKKNTNKETSPLFDR